MKRRLISVLGYLLAAWLLPEALVGASVAPARRIHPADELMWWDVRGQRVITGWTDGTVGVWDLRSGGLQSHFRVETEKVKRPYKWLGVSHDAESPSLAVLEGVTTEETFYSIIAVYDVLSGRLRQRIRVEMLFLRSHGFRSDREGLILGEQPPGNAVVLELDLASARPRWISESEDNVQSGTLTALNGERHVQFCFGRVLRGRDSHSQGALVWEKKLPAGQFAEPGYRSRSPSLPYVVAFVTEWGGDAKQFRALSPQDGSEIWRLRDMPYGAIRAISRDGERQVIVRDGAVSIANLPGEDRQVIWGIEGAVEAVFSEDGAWLFCVPALVKVSEDKEARTFTVGRESRMLLVIDTATAEVRRSFELTHPGSE